MSSIQGQIFREDGSFCTSDSAALDIEVDASLITETAPFVTLPGDGTFQIGDEVSPASDSLTIRIRCEGEQGEVTLSAAASGADIHLAPENYVQPVQNFDLSTTSDYKTVFLLWEGHEGATYDVYRANPATPWDFNRVADSLVSESFFDSGVEPDSAYEYTVVLADSSGRSSGRGDVLTKAVPPPPPEPTPSLFDEIALEQLRSTAQDGPIHVAAFQRTLQMSPGESDTLRMIREVAADPEPQPSPELVELDLNQVIVEAEDAFDRVAEAAERPMVYWSAMNLTRQSIATYPDGTYFVDRRGIIDPRRGLLQEPSNLFALGEVTEFDRDLSRQIVRTVADKEAGGIIPYWTGPIETPSSPNDPAFPPMLAHAAVSAALEGSSSGFLQMLYDAATAAYNRWSTSDADGDGLTEWHTALESMRPTSVIWDAADPSEVEALDLNTMMVREAHALDRIAPDSAQAVAWRLEARARDERIRDTFWDDGTGFFYHVDLASNEPTETLQRPEIIGFMVPASPDQRHALRTRAEDPAWFNRRYGMPTLSAADSAYHPSGTWNGPIHMGWALRAGPQAHGYEERLADALEASLSESHDFYELYSPDHAWGGHEPGGVENALIAATLRTQPDVAAEQSPTFDSKTTSYPNPFEDGLTIEYALRMSTHVRVTIHDVLGRQVAVLVDERQQPGRHDATWRPRYVATGLYVYRIERGGEVQTGSATYLGGRP